MFARLACFVALTLLFTSASVAEEKRIIADPLEPFNRGMHWFNDKADTYFLEPIAKGYNTITPDSVQEGVRNFFSNIRYPQYLISDLVEGEGCAAMDHTARFFINSTIGFLGIFDLASDMGFPENPQDFGQALGKQGVGEGAYLVIPFIGPSSLRDGTGRLVDAVLYPFFWVGSTGASQATQNSVSLGATGTEFVQTRADLIEAIKAGKESAVDEYLFMQGAYVQHRRAIIDGQEIDTNAPKKNPFADDVE